MFRALVMTSMHGTLGRGWQGNIRLTTISVTLCFPLAVMAPTLGSFWQFQRMVKHVTGRSAFFSYYGYGCYCGLGGKGVPVDDTDRWVQRRQDCPAFALH